MIPGQVQQKLRKAQQFLLAQNFAQALPRYEKLSQLCPGDAVVWFEYGNAAAGLRDRALANCAWHKAMQLAPRDAGLLTQIGHQFQGFRDADGARSCFAQAAAADPRAINPRISVALLSEQNHLLPQARAPIEECLAIDPHDDQARYLSAVLDRREDKLEQAERRLRDLIASSPRHPYVRYACRYELAQVLDRTDRFDEAMRLLVEAKQIVGGLTDIGLLLRGYDREADHTRRFTQSLPKTILGTWAEVYPEAQREAVPSLTFLGGHPRSGTTLLERVLDAHPGVAALDEPSAFLDFLQPEFHKLNELSNQRLNTLRRLYTQALLQEAGVAAHGKLLVDKNPSPTAWLPLWLRMFPELRVLIALRDPRDVVLSCYFQNILLNATNVNFLSFERLAKHYADLMDIWLTVREWDGFCWLETRYEDMVTDLDREGRRVAEFLGLSWHEDQAMFYEKSQTKQLYSPTYQDVTRPVYTRSVGRWRAYEKYLTPIFPALEPYCQKFGYD
jgi:tetratricopeptide (TPR) repeat protein